MAHVYAGFLGPLAFLTALARGLIHGSEPESVVLTAWLSLMAFAAVGYIVGWIAEQVVRDSVYGKISSEVAATETSQPDADAA